MLQLTRSCNIWIFFLENLKGYKVYIEVKNRFCVQKTGDHANWKNLDCLEISFEYDGSLFCVCCSNIWDKIYIMIAFLDTAMKN